MRTFSWHLLIAVALLSACGSGTQPTDELNVVNTEDSVLQADRLKRTRNIFYSIPSPMETAALLQKAGATYNSKILNDVKKVDTYTTASEQALNLGVYGADLSYASVFNHTQESMFYTSCSKKLADRLGVISAFNDSTLELMEKNMGDRDALLDVISETYWNVDAYLKENGRDNISALMIAGGWMEGLYIATQVSLTNDSPELRQRIAEQKLSLVDLIALISSYELDDPALSTVMADLKALETLFADVPVGGGSTTVTQENGVALIGGDSKPSSINDEQLAAIREKAAAVRNSYIN
ncbi:MAG: hypothetical protein IPO05_10275 [Flavobacteriales bacterium]|jgi:hypothetical protein|nr:hypothetical protein [Flavobacteriales bacterium]MBK9513989.1 hypothetical protein [Flavobacteriales bacterium]MBP7448760.1 hypothetical protein [Flavobacteriales bacterium]